MPFFDQYPYTNFHNVNLDWVLERVKAWGELVEQNNTAFHSLEEANEDFKTYVENYLQNIDVQDEINIKMDSLLESGVLTEYLQPYISTDVSAWLDENITEPTGVVIDTSLTVAGACADAKETGNRISAIFTNNAKSILMNAFRNLAWINNNGKMLYDALQVALFNGDVFNKWHYSLSNHDLIKSVNSGDPEQDYLTYPSRVTLNPIARRRNISVNYGVAPYYVFEESEEATLYFPVPIPQTAQSFTISMQPTTQFIFVNVVPYNPVRNWYDNTIGANRITWTQMTAPVTKQITRNDDSMLFMVINIKYDSAGNTYPVEPTEFKIDFN